MKSAGIITLMSDPLCGWLTELSRIQPQLHFIQLRHQFQLLLLCSDTSKNMIKIILPFFVNKTIFVNISSNFLHAIFRPQATIWTKNPGNSTTNTAKTTPLFYKRRNKFVKSCSLNLFIKRWIVENGLAVILTPKSTS